MDVQNAAGRKIVTPRRLPRWATPRRKNILGKKEKIKQGALRQAGIPPGVPPLGKAAVSKASTTST